MKTPRLFLLALVFFHDADQDVAGVADSGEVVGLDLAVAAAGEGFAQQGGDVRQAFERIWRQGEGPARGLAVALAPGAAGRLSFFGALGVVKEAIFASFGGMGLARGPVPGCVAATLPGEKF